jgi:hypothetical protein
MSDPIWYYAKDEQQHGPVTPAQLKSLSNSGKLLPTDLVWKEGMGDWAPASDVKGLFTFVPVPPPPPADLAAGEEVAETSKASPTSGSSSTAVTSPTPEPVPPAGSSQAVSGREPQPTFVPAAQPPAAPTTAAPVAVVGTPTSVSERAVTRSAQRLYRLGRPLLFGGLFLILLTRGCDSLAERYAASLAASAEVVELQFNDAWAAKRAPLEAQRDALVANAERTLDDNIRLENIETQLSTLNAEMQKERAAKQVEWNALRTSARDSEASTRQWAFWRQLVFLPAALVFVIGLILVGSHAEGPERWLSLVMLAIVVYSLLVGGAAW